MNNKIIPDFYLICPHGVGTLSFFYYLTWLGTPSSIIETNYQDGKQDPVIFPVLKTPYIYRRGISCDRVIVGKPLAYGEENQKIIQLIRDPIDALTSFINWYVSSAVCLNMNQGTNIKILNNSSKLNFFNMFFHIICMFTSMRNSISSKDTTLFIDINDLSGSQCAKTMQNVSEYLNVKYNDKLNEICKVSFNSFINRMWRWQPQKNFGSGQLSTYIHDISVFPSFLHDFWANQWELSHILDVFYYNNEEYTVSMPERYFYERGNITRENIWDEEKRESMKRVIDIWMAHREVSERLYRQYAMTWEDTIALIRSQPRFRSRFLRLMEHEISLPLKEVPEKVERWTHFHSL